MRSGIRGHIVKLRGLWLHPRSRKPYYRTRKGGKVTLTELPDLPHDHPDFIAAWAQAARTGTVTPPPKAGTIASLWTAALGSDRAHKLSAVYRAKLHLQSRLICAKAGHVAATALREHHIRKDVAEAPDPRNRLKAWRWWALWCIDHGHLTTNPARAVARPRTAPGDGHPPWTADHIAAFRARWPIGTAPRAAMELLHWTGARVSDAVLIGPQMVGKDGVLAFRQCKTGAVAYVPWTCALPAFARVDDRDQMMASISPFAGHMTFLATKFGRTRSAKALSTMIQSACKAAEIPVSAHGLRKSRAVTLVESGATPHQTGAWTGHAALTEIVRYARTMDRRASVIGTLPERAGETVADQRETG